MQYLKLMILQKITFYTFRSIIREQLLTRHLVDTTTALVPYHCLVGSVEIRRTKDFHPLDNARAEHNKSPNRHNHRLGADNNEVMTHLSISSLSSRRPRCRCRQGARSIAGSASHPSRYRYPLRGQERRLGCR